MYKHITFSLLGACFIPCYNYIFIKHIKNRRSPSLIPMQTTTPSVSFSCRLPYPQSHPHADYPALSLIPMQTTQPSVSSPCRLPRPQSHPHADYHALSLIPMQTTTPYGYSLALLLCKSPNNLHMWNFTQRPHPLLRTALLWTKDHTHY